jgi:hypothetical protein
LRTYDSSGINISGGSVTWIYAWNTSTIIISGGVVKSIDAMPNTTINVADGIISNGLLVVHNYSTLNITGGQLDVVYTKFYGQHAVNIWGYGFDYDSTKGLLTGYLSDDNPFSMKVANLEGINLITEPATLLLMTCGLWFARRG